MINKQRNSGTAPSLLKGRWRPGLTAGIVDKQTNTLLELSTNELKKKVINMQQIDRTADKKRTIKTTVR